jgi:putative CocE/NonD family hydrolase
VPTRGGPVCCTGNPADRSGPIDQRDVEERRDVLVYTSRPLETDLRIAGPVRARIVFSSNAPDTDLVVRLVDVTPDGRAIGLQEGALRLRYQPRKRAARTKN